MEQTPKIGRSEISMGLPKVVEQQGYASDAEDERAYGPSTAAVCPIGKSVLNIRSETRAGIPSAVMECAVLGKTAVDEIASVVNNKVKLADYLKHGKGYSLGTSWLPVFLPITPAYSVPDLWHRLV